MSGRLALEGSRVRDLTVDTGTIQASLRDSTLTIAQLEMRGPAVDGRGSGTVGFAGETTTDFGYDVTRADLSQLEWLTGQQAGGIVASKGRLTGTWSTLRAAGDVWVTQLDAYSVNALTATAQYDVTLPSGDAARAKARITGRAGFVTLLGQSVLDASGTLTYDAQRLGFDVALKQQEGREGRLAGTVVLRLDQREASLEALTVTLGRLPWTLAAPAAPTVTWSDQQIAVTPMEFVAGSNGERIGIAGTWRTDGKGALRVTANRVFLDTLQAAFERPTRYGGVIDLDATISGTRDKPEASGTVTISNGRVERVSYQKLEARFTYGAQMFDVDARLDQAPGVWVTAVGKIPLGLMDPTAPEQPIDVTVKSSTISLGLIEGITDVVRNVSGDITLDVKAIGTSHDPHMGGTIAIANAGFLVVPTGSRYKNTRAALTLTTDRITVDSLHVEDADGRPLDVHGSLGTHELRVGELQIEGTARHFEVMHNELGSVNIDASVRLQGRWEAPRIAGDVTIQSGTLRVDEILSRALFQPYATEQTRMSDVDAVAALNPWDRLGLDLALHVPATLRLVGDSVQVSQDTPIGLGNINLRVRGDLYLYKDPGDVGLDHRIVRPDHGHLRVPGAHLRRARNELDQLSRRSQPRDLRHRDARHLRCRGARQHLRTAQAARAAAGQHAAAR